MALDFDFFRVREVTNPSLDCVQINFQHIDDPVIKRKSLVLFESQIKYIVTEEMEDRKRVKVFVRDDSDPMIIDFHPEEYEQYEGMFLALYNKNV